MEEKQEARLQAHLLTWGNAFAEIERAAPTAAIAITTRRWSTGPAFFITGTGAGEPLRATAHPFYDSMSG